VCLYGSLRDEEALGDLAVCVPLGGEACDAQFAGGQRVDAGEDGLAGAPAGGEEFFAGARCERGRGSAVGEFEGLS